jgi:hypothetical protein
MQFLPDDFVIPVAAEKDFKIVPLCMDNLMTDYGTVMSSQNNIRLGGNLFLPPGVDLGWPSNRINLRSHLVALAGDEMGFVSKARVGYAIVSPDGSEQYGCIYVWTPSKVGFDADLFVWMREDLKDQTEDYFAWAKKFVLENFPVQKLGCPGREIPWDEWEKLEDRLIPVMATLELLGGDPVFTNFPPSSPGRYIHDPDNSSQKR